MPKDPYLASPINQFHNFPVRSESPSKEGGGDLFGKRQHTRRYSRLQERLFLQKLCKHFGRLCGQSADDACYGGTVKSCLHQVNGAGTASKLAGRTLRGCMKKTGKFRAVINGIRQAARSVNPGDGKSDPPLDLSESGNTHNVLAAMDMPIAAMP